jgi:hypothetical protein
MVHIPYQNHNTYTRSGFGHIQVFYVVAVVVVVEARTANKH